MNRNRIIERPQSWFEPDDDPIMPPCLHCGKHHDQCECDEYEEDTAWDPADDWEPEEYETD